MRRILERVWRTGIVGTFLTGLFFVLPVFLTVVVVTWLIGKLQALLGPDTWLGEVLSRVGAAVFGTHHATVGFWLGVLLALAAIWVLGFVVRTRARHVLERTVSGLIDRVPIVRTVYGPVAQVVALLRRGGRDDVAGMQVVLCRFGPTGGATVLALLTSNAVYRLDEGACHLVYLPTSPLPMSGALTFVPVDAVTPVPEIDVDGLMRIYFSLGALSGQVMPERLVAGGGG